ncbi:unnamed protein product [Soboliphyme baturini]|uniref:Secreted protein n=1 Tax=Soboliphyme baturini TaxID=241478 RepID=A0A183J6K4_9BILA|nr:unnamed protein product [Soboliphyme baturini]
MQRRLQLEPILAIQALLVIAFVVFSNGRNLPSWELRISVSFCQSSILSTRAAGALFGEERSGGREIFDLILPVKVT